MAGRQINEGSLEDATAQDKMVGHFLHKISARHSTDKIGCWIRGSVLLPRGRLAVMDKNNMCVKLFEASKLTGKVSFSLEPQDITAIGEDRLAVVFNNEQQYYKDDMFLNPIDYQDDENKQLQYKNKELQFLQLLRVEPKLARSIKLPLPGRSYKGVTCQGEKLYLACRDPPSIQIFNLHGTLLSNQPNNEGLRLYGFPSSIAVSPDGAHIYVCSCRNVVCLTTEGQKVWTFIPRGRLFSILRGIDVDKQGRVFVCGDDDPPIHILSSAGRPGTLLLKMEDMVPWTVAVGDGRMYLGGKNRNKISFYLDECNEISVYRLEAADSARQEEDSDDFADSDEDSENNENSDEEEEEVEGEDGEDEGVVNDREDDDGGGEDVLDNTEESLRENTVESVDMQLQYVCEDLPPPVDQSMNLPGDISLRDNTRDRESLYRLPDNNRCDSPSENQPLELPSQILFRDTNRDRESYRLAGSNRPDVLLEDIEEEPPVKLPKFE